jgi:SOS-response transcriptional repressor LexA
MKKFGLKDYALARRSEEIEGAGKGVTQPTINRICSGETPNPKAATIAKLERALPVPPGTLMNAGASPGVQQETATYALGMVPLIHWVELSAWLKDAATTTPGESARLIPCPKAHSPRTVALRVRGDSMRGRFREGEIIFVDPAREARHNHYVLARVGENWTFRRLRTQDGRYLQALHPDFRIQELTDDALICGVVIGKWWDPEEELDQE